MLAIFNKRWWKYWWQRRTRGWDDSVTWNLDKDIAKFVLPRLRRFKEIKCGYHGDSEEEWDETLDKMIYGLQRLSDEFDLLLMDESHEEALENNKKMAEGLSLFGEYLPGLWD